MDVIAACAREPIVTSGKLIPGNFSTADTAARTSVGTEDRSRVFRRLIDDLQVFDEGLSLEEIQRLQPAASVSGQVALEAYAGPAGNGNGTRDVTFSFTDGLTFTNHAGRR